MRRRTVIRVIDKISIESVNVIDNSLPCDSETKEETFSVTLDDQLKVISQKGITLDQTDLSADEYKTLVKVLYYNSDLFVTGMHDLVVTGAVKMDFDTGDAKPVRKRSYRQSPQMMREIEKQVQKMVSAGIVEPSDSL